MTKFNFRTIMVHAGIFHADDILCVAMAQILNPNIRVERVLKVPDITDDTIVCDIGGGRYDHHQPDSEVSEGGHKYAACGLFFRDFGSLIFPRVGSMEGFRDRFIEPIEDADNGLTSNPLSASISAFNGGWDATPEEKSQGFDDACDFARGIINREIRNMEGRLRAEASAAEAILNNNEDGIVTLSQYLPTDLFIGSGAKLLVTPSLRGGWQILTVKVNNGTFDDVIPLPAEWLNQKPEGCTFVHPARFIASFDTREAAQKAAKLVV